MPLSLWPKGISIRSWKCGFTNSALQISRSCVEFANTRLKQLARRCVRQLLRENHVGQHPPFRDLAGDISQKLILTDIGARPKDNHQQWAFRLAQVRSNPSPPGPRLCFREKGIRGQRLWVIEPRSVSSMCPRRLSGCGKAGGKRAFGASPGNLWLERNAWWARQDSNLQPDRYERWARDETLAKSCNSGDDLC